MGRRCYTKKISCNPCCPPYYNPCCPPFFGPCCPPPFCCPPPCCDDFSHPSNCGCDSCSSKGGKSYFSASSSNTVDLSGLTSPPAPVITFAEQQDCLCEYANDTTFIPKCKGYYSMKVNVTVTSDIDQTVSVNLVVNGAIRATVSKDFTTSISSQVFTINQSVCLNKFDNVYVTITSTVSSPFENTTQITGVRSFSGSRCGNSGSSCCGSSSSCCSSGCSSCH